MYVFDSHFDEHAVARQILQDYKVCLYSNILYLCIYNSVIAIRCEYSVHVQQCT
jgi:hypothetical protein